MFRFPPPTEKNNEHYQKPTEPEPSLSTYGGPSIFSTSPLEWDFWLKKREEERERNRHTQHIGLGR